jgi:hypothetical protein
MLNPRRKFIYKAMAVAGSATLFPQMVFGKATSEIVSDKIDQEIVKEFVSVAHSDFKRMKTLLEKHPNLLNAANDWGDGDFETAIGAAGHMGHKDFAKYLIENGARFDIFVLTMLGQTEIVMPFLEAYPSLITSIGPHGFTLLHHAEKGGDDAKELYDYLESKGLTEKFIPTFKKN